MTEDPDDTALLAAWARTLEARLQPGTPQAGLRARLMARVAASAQVHAAYRTVRRETAVWSDEAPGVTVSTLRADEAFRVDLVKLAPGVAVPTDASGTGAEWLLLEGRLRDPAKGTALPPCSYAVQVGPPTTPTPQADGPALLYRRTRQTATAAIPALEAQWWPAAPFPAAADPAWQPPGPWTDTGPGVQVMRLRARRHVVSMLVRFAAGAGVPDHGHELDEDCLVLQGEMFLGDILLRAGDYQLALAGGGHFGETSDVGVVFYFHGALDTALRTPRAA